MTLTVDLSLFALCRSGVHPMVPENLNSKGECKECEDSSRSGRVSARVAKMVQLLVGFRFQPKPGWAERGKCKGENYELFELAEATRTTPSHVVERINARRHAQARVFCEDCPVVAECLGEALTNRLVGCWGGELLTPDDWAAAYKARKLIEEAS